MTKATDSNIISLDIRNSRQVEKERQIGFISEYFKCTCFYAGEEVKGFNIDINVFSTKRVHRDHSGIVQIRKFEYDVLPFDGYYNDNIIDVIMSQPQLNLDNNTVNIYPKLFIERVVTHRLLLEPRYLASVDIDIDFLNKHIKAYFQMNMIHIVR